MVCKFYLCCSIFNLRVIVTKSISTIPSIILGCTLITSLIKRQIPTNKIQKNSSTENSRWRSFGWVSYLHRAATTNYLCCGQALEDSLGAGRIGLTHISVYISSILKESLICNRILMLHHQTRPSFI